MIYGIFYLTAFLGLGALCYALLFIGRSANQCPQSAGATKLASLIVTIGFATIGTGAVAIIGAALPLIKQGETEAISLMVGITAITLGVGFWNAASSIRDIVKDAQTAVEQSR